MENVQEKVLKTHDTSEKNEKSEKKVLKMHDTFENLIRDLAKTHGFFEVTCRKCDRGARKRCAPTPLGGG